jgi:hypothetical protein
MDASQASPPIRRPRTQSDGPDPRCRSGRLLAALAGPRGWASSCGELACPINSSRPRRARSLAGSLHRPRSSSRRRRAPPPPGPRPPQRRRDESLRPRTVSDCDLGWIPHRYSSSPPLCSFGFASLLFFPGPVGELGRARSGAATSGTASAGRSAGPAPRIGDRLTPDP